MGSTNRELPLPAGLSRLPLSIPTPLPPPPPQWPGAEYMQHWLTAKMEEDRRGQEEERTRQESLRLELRRMEQELLMQCLQSEIPRNLVPFVFIGLNGRVSASQMFHMLQPHMPASVWTDGQMPLLQTALNPGIPVTLPPTSQPPITQLPITQPPITQPPIIQPPATQPQATQPQATQPARQVTPIESQGDWEKRMEAYFGSRRAPPKKQNPNKDSLPSAAVRTQNTQVAPPPNPRTPQKPLTPRPPRPTSYTFELWTPPGHSKSKTSMGKDKPESSQPLQPPPLGRSESQSSANRKRKSQLSHHKEPPPPCRLNNETTRASRNGTEDRTHPHQKNGAPKSHELRSMDGDSDQDREQALRLPAESTENAVEERIERDDDRRSPGPHVSNDPRSPIEIVSDDEVASDRS